MQVAETTARLLEDTNCQNQTSSILDPNTSEQVVNFSKLDRVLKAKLREQRLKCNDCGRICRDSTHLREHLRQHTGERPFSCHICEKKFFTNSSLQSHIRIHKGDWKYVCVNCGKGFVNKTAFSNHERRKHTFEKPYSCEICDKRFPSNQQMQIHKEQHQNVLSYECNQCDRKYVSINSLRSHKRTHAPLEERRKHKCTLCAATYMTKFQLQLHLRKHTEIAAFELLDVEKS